MSSMRPKTIDTVLMSMKIGRNFTYESNACSISFRSLMSGDKKCYTHLNKLAGYSCRFA